MRAPTPPDFEAEVVILPRDDKRPVFNGLRYGFAFPEDLELSLPITADIWPIFIDANGETLPAGQPLTGKLTAHMHMVSVGWSHPYAARIAVGAQFFMVEGAHRVASGSITAILSRENK